MSLRTSRRGKRQLRGFASAALAGSIISLFTTDVHAEEAAIQPARQLDSFKKDGMLQFPSWEPLFEASSGSPASIPDKNPRSSGVKVERHGLGEEIILAAPESLDEAIRVAATMSGASRESAMASLWRRYNTEVLIRSLKSRIESGTLEEATIATEVFLDGGDPGHKIVVGMLLSSQGRVGDRTVYALANLGARAAAIFGEGLDSELPDAHMRCAWGLGRVGGIEAARMLGKLSSNPEPQLRMVAVEALGAMDPEERAGQLQRFVADDVSSIRRRLAEVYAGSPAPEARAVLSRLSGDRDSSVRVAVVVALSMQENGGADILPAFLHDEVVPLRAEAARGLAILASNDNRTLLLHNADRVVRTAAFEAMLERSDVEVGVFAALADDPDPQLRRRALERIMQEPSQEGADAALAFLIDPDQGMAVDALAFVHRAGVDIDPMKLVPAAGKGSEEVQRRVVAELVAAGTPRALEALSHFVAVADPQLRQTVIKRLGEKPNDSQLAALRPVRQDKNRDTRKALLATLAKMPSDGALEQLEGFLDDPDPELRRAAAEQLGNRKDPRSVLALASHGNDELKVRRAIVGALDKIGDDAAAGGLAAFLADPETDVRQKALRSLEKIGSPMALGFIGETFANPDQETRNEAVAALRRSALEQPTVVAQQLGHFFHDPDQGVQLAAIAAAGATGDGEAVAALTQLSSEQEARVRQGAVAALQRVRDNRAIEGLKRFLPDQDEGVRRGAYQGFAQVGGPEGYAMLVKGLDDAANPVRVTVAQAVGDLRLGIAVPGLKERLLFATDVHEMKALIGALAQIPSVEARDALMEIQEKGTVFQKVLVRKAMDQAADPQDEAKDLQANLRDVPDRS